MKVEMIIHRREYYRPSRQDRIDQRMIRLEWDFPKYSYAGSDTFEGQVIGYYAKENCAGLKVRDRNGFVGYISSDKAKRIYYCAGVGCYNHVEFSGDRCPSCTAKWNAACDAYRRCRAGATDDADLQRRINQFRAGKTDW